MIKRIESGLSEKELHADYLSWVKFQAVHFDLTGTIFIKDDGSVKIIAEGEEVNLNGFIRILEKGHLLTPVENFYIVWKEPTREYKDFSVGHI
jgi:acylphosphatase